MLHGGSGSGKLLQCQTVVLESRSRKQPLLGSGVTITAHSDDSATGILLPSGAKAGNVTTTGNHVISNAVTNENLVLTIKRFRYYSIE